MPISPVDTTWQDGGTQVRTQLPLRLCWAITLHKSQGQTLDKAVIDLGPKEACTGLSFVCLGRANRLVDLIAEPMSFDRIGNLGNCRKRLARSTSRSRASCCFPCGLAPVVTVAAGTSWGDATPCYASRHMMLVQLLYGLAHDTYPTLKPRQIFPH